MRVSGTQPSPALHPRRRQDWRIDLPRLRMSMRELTLSRGSFPPCQLQAKGDRNLAHDVDRTDRGTVVLLTSLAPHTNMFRRCNAKARPFPKALCSSHFNNLRWPASCTIAALSASLQRTSGRREYNYRPYESPWMQMQSLCPQKLNNEQDKQLSKQRQSLMQPLANLSCFYCNVYSDDSGNR